MSDAYLWLLSLHIMAFAAWMAGLWYLPRLLVYHCDVEPGSPTSETFKVMERRLLRAITTPAMVVTFVLGIVLAFQYGVWVEGWLHAKFVLVCALAACHGLLARDVKAFAADRRPHGERWYRVFNEAPTLIFIGIVILVVFKPF